MRWLFILLLAGIAIESARASRKSLEQQTLAQTPLGQVQPRRRDRRWLRWLTVLSAWVFGMATLVGVVDQVWGPFWPTSPTVESDNPDRLPLYVPVKIGNESMIWRLYNVQVACAVDKLRGGNIAEDRDLNITLIPYIETSSSHPFTCSSLLNISPRPTETAAKMQIFITWTWNFRFRVYRQTKSWCLNWDTRANPPQWRIGCAFP
jgi:hypothetical protein